jgi:protein ImuB
VECGWWDRVNTPAGEQTRQVARDYWVALSETAGVLWVFQERQAQSSDWYLHGVFA